MNVKIKYIVLAVLGLTTSAAAGLKLSWTGTAYVTEKQKVGGMWQITVATVGSPSMTFRVEADGTEEKIRYIRVQPEPEAPLTFGNCNLIVRGINGGKVVRVEEISWVPALTPADLWVGELTIKKDSGGGEGGLGTGSGGEVLVDRLGTIDVEGDITADLTILSGGTMGGSSGWIGNVSVGGDLLGDVTSQREIRSLIVAGNIGSSTNTVLIAAGEQIEEVVAGTIWADIVSVALGPIDVFATTDGDFNGSLTVGDAGSAFGSGINIARDLNADVAIYGDLVNPIRIRGSLLGDIGVDGDVLDQVFINSAVDSGSWSGDVFLGATTLSPKGAYTQTGLGGGAVGLAPFSLHKQDCYPPYSGSTPPTTTSSSIAIDLVHYGPIRHDGAGKPFRVEKYEGYCSGPCIQPDADDTDNWTLDSVSGRTMTISGPLEADHHYHVYPMRTGTDMLKCDELDAAGDVPVAPYAYIIYREP